VTAYRDQFEKCPRCATELVDAGAGRACTACRGQWVTGPILQEMVTAMRSPPQPIQLRFVEDSHEVLACPECGRAMETWRLHDVPIDRCPEWHGIWFDRDELQRVLLGSVRFER
jgi:Zn-finger nucleic acid-binding protein